MSTITAPGSVQQWPRAALAATLLLAVALVVTIVLALTVGQHTSIRTVVHQVPAVDQSYNCRFGRPC